MTEETKEKIVQLKKDFRANMNGVASASMREAGIGYRLNFGIELPRIKAIVSAFEPDHELAQELWKEDVRESKIAATMLQPVDSFCSDLADIWVERVGTAEMAGIVSMNLFQHLPYAQEKAFQWIASDNENQQLCGYHTLIYLLRRTTLTGRQSNELIDHAICTLGWLANPASLRQVAWKVMLQHALQNDQARHNVIAAMKDAGFDETDELKPYLEYLETED